MVVLSLQIEGCLKQAFFSSVSSPVLHQIQLCQSRESLLMAQIHPCSHSYRAEFGQLSNLLLQMSYTAAIVIKLIALLSFSWTLQVHQPSHLCSLSHTILLVSGNALGYSSIAQPWHFYQTQHSFNPHSTVLLGPT